MTFGLTGSARFAVQCVLLALLLFLVFSNSSSANTAVVTVGDPGPFGVSVSFSPSSVTILKGDSVTWCWANADCTGSTGVLFPHSTSSGVCVGQTCTKGAVNGMSWDSGDQRSGSFTQNFGIAGTFTYFCDVHTYDMQGSVTVQPYDSNNPVSFAVLPSTSTPTAGSDFTVTVQALDRNGNIVGDFNGSVTLSDSAGKVASFLPDPVTITNGVGTLTANLQTSGAQTITATNGSISGTASVNVLGAAATHFAVGATGIAGVGSNFNFSVTAEDQFNNPASNYSGTLQLSSVSDPSAVFSPNSTPFSGFGVFGVTFDTVGAQDITVTDGTLTGSATVQVSDCAFRDQIFPAVPASNGITFSSIDFGLSTSSPNPSQITVSGMNGQVVGKLTVKINGFSEQNASDSGFLLVGPGGESLVLMSSAGGSGTVSNVDLVIDDAAPTQVSNTALVSGSYQPTDYNTYTFLSPAPTSPNVPAPIGTATLASTFLGTTLNGTWSLYAVDRGLGSTGSITGWSITFTPAYSFASSGPIVINDSPSAGVAIPATPYPSQISVSGLQGDIADVALTLNSFNDSSPADVSVLLVGPGGLAFVPLSHTGGGNPGENNVTFTLDDFGAAQVPKANFAADMYQPTARDNGIALAFPAPAPAAFATPAPVGSATFSSVYGRSDPNGTWSLYVIDDNPGGSGMIAGWTLTFRLHCPALTQCQVQSGTNPSSFDQPVTFTAAVSAPSGPGTPTGTATFNDLDTSTVLGTAPLDGTGHAAITVPNPPLAVGTHHIAVDYSDGVTYHASTSTAVAQVVNQATTVTVVASSVNPTTYNQATIFTAKVTPAFGGLPTGTVTFTDTTLGMVLGTVPLNPLLRGILTYSALAVGTHNITATYNGDANYTGSTSPVKVQVVNKAPSSSALMSSLNPSTFGAAVALTATIGSTNGVTPTGTVNFMEGATMLGSGTLSSSQTGILISTLSVGVHNLTAVYLGDGNFVGSTSPVLVQTVNRAATTTTVTSGLNPSTFGQTVTFNANVTSSGGTATGTVTFLDGATTLGTANLVNHRGSFTTSALTGGTHSITVAYSGDTSFAPSTSSVLMQGVNRAATTASLTANRTFIHFRQGSTVTITLTSGAPGTPTGTVTFSDNGVAFASLSLVNGAAGGTPLFGKLGLHAITVTYNGDTNFAPSSSNEVDIYKSARPHGNPPLPSEN